MSAFSLKFLSCPYKRLLMDRKQKKFIAAQQRIYRRHGHALGSGVSGELAPVGPVRPSATVLPGFIPIGLRMSASIEVAPC
jgi:hypothetical protein